MPLQHRHDLPSLDLPALDRADPLDPDSAGRKAATLARLRGAGFPVPDGFVIPATAAPLDAELTRAVLAAAARLGGGPFAVRSSGVDEDGDQASHAGQYRTVLGVAGDGPLLAAIEECRSSAGSDQVRAYRAARGLPPDAALAVLVQRMVAADVAGVAFSADPVSGDRSRTLVNAVRGLGDRLVDGSATPDEWSVRGGVAERRPGGEEAIDAGLAREVAALAERVVAAEGVPQDIEWAVAAGELFLLQARPITGLPDPAPEPVPIAIDPPPGYWTREESHAPQPWTPFTRQLMSIRNEATRRMMAEFGFLLDGIGYADLGGWEYIRLVPLGGVDRPAPPAWLMPLLLRLVPAMRTRIRTCLAAVRDDTAGALIQRWYDSWRPEFVDRVARLREADLTACTDEQLDRHLARTLACYDDGDLVHFRLHAAIVLQLGDLHFTCEELFGWDTVGSLALVSGLSTRSTEPGRRLAELAELARSRPEVRRLLERADPPAELPAGLDADFAREFTRYQHDIGCRGLRYEVAEPTLAEVPRLTFGLIRDQLATGYDPAAEDAATAARRDAAIAAARQLLAGRSDADRQRFERALGRAELAYPVREDNEFFTVSAPTGLVRLAALEVGRRLVARGLLAGADDAFFLEPAELRDTLRSGAARQELITRRRGERAWALAHPGPVAYGPKPGSPPALDALPAEARQAMRSLLWGVEHVIGPEPVVADGPAGAVLRGLPASAGRYTGPVKIIRSEAEFDRIRAGDVLVCPTTSPVWSVLFPSIGALITETGGVLSHPAIIAREHQVPAVVAAGRATELLRDGEPVTVDGTTGTVVSGP
ncbi:PEP/pyruvate-binding domain-containing protein [Microlunatus speluncae]|uniref:PEP/pyruvate-binding domain-containing protein n=1 Tax=Microlunatus speluncae TaxID=2594267 RepID=UPI0012663A72|nr:PEP/pyruvate-binding domain-containing protein [Microlunatus speluncae]